MNDNLQDLIAELDRGHVWWQIQRKTQGMFWVFEVRLLRMRNDRPQYFTGTARTLESAIRGALESEQKS